MDAASAHKSSPANLNSWVFCRLAADPCELASWEREVHRGLEEMAVVSEPVWRQTWETLWRHDLREPEVVFEEGSQTAEAVSESWRSVPAAA